jgi:hypothetical protein
MAQVEGIVENKTLVKKSLDRNIGTITLDNPSKHNALAWIIQQGSSQKRKDALKGMMNTGFADPAFPFGASIS